MEKEIKTEDESLLTKIRFKVMDFFKKLQTIEECIYEGDNSERVSEAEQDKA